MAGGHPGLLKSPGKPSKTYCGLVALSYMVFAVTLLFFNKAALSSYKFPNANIITLAQLCCANALLYVLRKCKVISFTDDVALIPRDCIDGRTGFPVREERGGEEGGGLRYDAHYTSHRRASPSFLKMKLLLLLLLLLLLMKQSNALQTQPLVSNVCVVAASL